MKTLVLLAALGLSVATCLAETSLWQDEGSRVGQTFELRELHVQQCQRRHDQWGLMDVTGKIKPVPVSRLIGIDEKDGCIAARIKNSNLRKLITPRGKIIPEGADVEIVNVMTEYRIPIKYLSNAQFDYKFSFCTESGYVLPAKFDQVSPFSDGVAAVRIGKLVGFIGLDGKFLPNSKMVDCQFQEGISDGRLAARMNGLWGYLDTSGHWIVSPKFKFAKPFQNGFALVSPVGNGQNHNSVTFIDRSGKQLDKEFYSGQSFEGEYAAVSVRQNQEVLWGLIDRAGQWVVEPKFSRIGPLIDSTRLLYDKDLVGVFSGRRIAVQPVYKYIGRFSNGLAPFQAAGSKLYGFLSTDGRVAVPAKFAFAGTFSEGLAAVRTYPSKPEKQAKIGFIDSHGVFRISPVLGGSDPSNPEFNPDFVLFHDGICLIPERSYWDGKFWSSGKGYINRLGKWIGPGPEVITMGFPFKMGKALVRYYPNRLENQLK
ncbi:MAG: WG repeat-containing protein [Candidatus Obscuribacter sp.]|nr:WG repeat-containing protein [Candidatus Obscuribacter sp.]MBK9276630.1 WG repeat-containing protein [Candidatus Obscuribacter sp.]